MELNTLEKDLVITILSRADGEDIDDIVRRSNFEEYLTRSLILRASNVEIFETLKERIYLKKNNNLTPLDV